MSLTIDELPSSTFSTEPSDLASRLSNYSAIRYIKLGVGGGWANDAIERGIIPLKFNEVPHALCEAGDWAAVRTVLMEQGRQTVADDLRELQAFYTLDEHCLWFTFADGHLYWAFAVLPVVPGEEAGDGGPTRYRRTIGGWRRCSLKGERLTKRTISSALTQLGNYRRTICEAKGREAYLLSKIRGDAPSIQRRAREATEALESLAAAMIAELDELDLEVLVDLLFTRGGWQRQTAVGKHQVDYDMVLVNSVTDEGAWVQIKSRADQRELDDYLDRFTRDGSCERFFFICHSPKGALAAPADPRAVVWDRQQLARRTVKAGLLDWLVELSG